MIGTSWKSWSVALVLAGTACSPEPVLEAGEPESCETADKNAWLYGVMQENYLWNIVVPEVDPSTFESPQELLRAVRYAPLDRWSRISDKTTTNALFMEGKAIGTGFRTLWDSEDRLRIATVQEGTPAAAAGLQRGDEIVAVGGLSLAEIEEQDVWDLVWGANEPGVEFTIDVLSQDGSMHTSTITRDWITLQTVLGASTFTHGGRPVGYLHFTSFLGPSEAELAEAFRGFKAAGARELIVDLRYNGGGLVSVARYLMNLLAGATAPGAVAYTVTYNENLVDLDSASMLESKSESVALDHVVFLVTGSTASASELVINAVRAHVPVSIVGSNTAGKPVGSNLFEFCDSIAAPITFELRNAQGVGGYFDGLPPDCTGGDDIEHPLGDPQEAMMAQALALLDTDACAPVSTEQRPGQRDFSLRAPSARLVPLRFEGLEELRGWM